jgi:predicted nucleic acid-binding protein
MYLLDTPVVADLRRAHPHPAVLAWLATVDDADLYLSAVTVGELQAAVEAMREAEPAKAAEIEAWLAPLAQSANVLAMDARVFRAFAKLTHGRADDSTQDAMIAATAQAHNLTVVTRDVWAFVALGARVLNPFEGGSRG